MRYEDWTYRAASLSEACDFDRNVFEMMGVFGSGRIVCCRSILYNGANLPVGFAAPGVQAVAIPAAEIADKLGSAKAANIVMVGALLEETECLAASTALGVLEDKVKKIDLLEIDRQALSSGRLFIDAQAHIGAVSQPDGFA